MIQTKNFNPKSDPKLLCTCGHKDCDQRSVNQETLYKLQAVRCWLDFLGFRIYGTHRLLRKSSVKRIKTKLRKYRKLFADGSLSLSDIDANIQSWIGHASHANTEGLKRSLFSKPFKRG